MSSAGQHRPGSKAPVPGSGHSDDPVSYGLKGFTVYLSDYFRNTPRKTFLLTAAFAALLIFLNYTAGIEPRIRALHPWPLSLLVFFVFYTLVF